MKKSAICFWIFAGALSHEAFAAAGNAYDGLQFILLLAGILVLLAALLWGIDQLRKNGRMLMVRLKGFLRKIFFHTDLPKSGREDLFPLSV